MRAKKGEKKRKKKEEEKKKIKFRYVFALESWVFGFLRFGMEICCSHV